MRVRVAELADVERMADLAAEKHAAQAIWEPGFWRVAPRAREIHPLYLRFLLSQPDVVARVSQDATGAVNGFVIARCAATCLIDDFNVAREELWPSVGRALLDTVLDDARAQATADLVVVCATRDTGKAAVLQAAGLGVSCAFRRIDLAGNAHADAAHVRPERASDAAAIAALEARAPVIHHGMPLADANLCCVIERDGALAGYVRAQSGLHAPPVYAPGGTAAFVHAFALSRTNDFATTGAELLAAFEVRARANGDAQLLLACAPSETAKRALLDGRGFRHPVDWYRRALHPPS